MPRAKRRKPNDLTGAAKVHDRRARELNRKANVAAIDVDDPLALHPGDQIRVLRSLRHDPLAALHSRRQIDEAQYQAGRAFQHDFEVAERGPRAIDPARDYVDGGRSPEPITEAMRRAVRRLNCAHRELGADGSALVHDILVRGLGVTAIAASRGLRGERWDRYIGQRFRECLDCLARSYGFATTDNGGGARREAPGLNASAIEIGDRSPAPPPRKPGMAE